MKLSLAVAVLASALAEAHCKQLVASPAPRGRANSFRHLPQHRQLGRLAIRPDDDQLPEQRPCDGRQLRPDPLL